MAIVVIRTAILYLAVILSLRIMGKRQIGELQPAELVITMLVSNLATLPIEDTDTPLLAGLLPILALCSFEVLLSGLSLKSRRARRLLTGTPRVVIFNGVIDRQELKNLRLSAEELLAQLRLAGVFDPAEVALAVVETNGQMSIYEAYAGRPLTPSAAGFAPCRERDVPPMPVISEGKLIEKAAALSGMTEGEILAILQREGIREEKVLLMTCGRMQGYHIVLKNGEERFSGQGK